MKRLSKNVLSLFVADIARRLLGFISVAYLARVLGKEEFGAINIGFAVLSYSMVIGASGFPILGAKKVAQGDSPEIVGNIIGSRIITELVTILVVTITVLIVVQESTLAWLIIIFTCSILPQIFSLDWFFQGKESLGIVSASKILQALIYLLVIIFFVKTPNDIFWVAIGSVAGECASVLLLLTRFRYLYSSVKVKLSVSFGLLKQSFPLAVGIMLSSFVINYPPIALGIFDSKAGVGLYSAASKILYFLMMGDRILFNLLIPVSARKQSESPQKLIHTLYDTMKWIALLGLPLTVGGMLVAEDVIKIIFGSDYVSSASIFKILVWYFLLTMFHTVFTSGLIAVGGEKKYGKVMILTAIAYLIFVSLGTIIFGTLGAAFGVVLAELFSVLLIYKTLKKIIIIKLPEKVFHIVICVVLMAVAIKLVLPYGFLITVIIGFISYSIFAFLTKAVSLDEIKLFLARFM